MRLSLSAFEVEHTTDVTKGLGRLHDLYKSGLRTRLFVVLPMRRRASLTGKSGAVYSAAFGKSVK